MIASRICEAPSVADPPAALTSGDLDAFARDGFVRLGRIVDDATLDALLDTEARFRPDAAYGERGKSQGLLVRDQLCDHAAALRDFCARGAHVPAVISLLGPDVAFTHTQFITKLPEPEPMASQDTAEADLAAAPTFIPFHQDDGYGTLEPPHDVTVWFALTDTDERNGCLRIVAGSHLGGLVPHEVARANAALREVVVDSSVAVPLAAGEAVAFSGLTLHGSGPNFGNAPRVGMHTRYCVPWARMMTEGGKLVLEDRYSFMVSGEAPLDAWSSANDKFLSHGAP